MMRVSFLIFYIQKKKKKKTLVKKLFLFFHYDESIGTKKWAMIKFIFNFRDQKVDFDNSFKVDISRLRYNTILMLHIFMRVYSVFDWYCQKIKKKGVEKVYWFIWSNMVISLASGAERIYLLCFV